MSEESQHRLVAVVIEVADLDRSAALYRDGFGLPLHPAHHDDEDRWIGGPHAAFSWTDGAFLHFALYQAKDDGPTSGVQVGFSVEDVEDARRRAIDAGAIEIHGPIPQPWGTSARFRDFDGNVIELSQPS